jgi:hypothetical protein
MDLDRARTFAERLHTGARDESGSPVLPHVRRVVRAIPEAARAVAWLHEVLQSTTVTEQELLAEGLTTDELRALRLLALAQETRAERVYLAHIDLIAQAAGRSGELARTVMIADLEDRCRHPCVRPDGSSPPYARALARLRYDVGLRDAASPVRANQAAVVHA